MTKKLHRARCLEEVELSQFAKEGYRGLLLDADNTLSPWNASEASAEVRQWLREAKGLGFQPIIVSNASQKRLLPLAISLNIPFRPRCNKPLPFGLRRAARQIGVPPKQCLMVGDQLLTDMAAGGFAGMQTILLDPIDTEHEYEGTKVNRFFERLLLKLFRL